MNTQWNPRYVQFCRAIGTTPERCDLPNYLFILWHSKRLNEARQQRPDFFHHGLYGMDVFCKECGKVIKAGGLLDQSGYDRWLKRRVDQLLEGKVEFDA